MTGTLRPTTLRYGYDGMRYAPSLVARATIDPNGAKMRTDGDLRQRRAHETERRVEVARPDLERELGPFEVAVDADGRCILSAHSGAQFEARLSSRHADARLVVEELSA